MGMRARLLFFALIVLLIPDPAQGAWYPDRRKSQFDTFFAYAVFPYPYSLPGIGTGLGLVGGAMNIGNTPVDAYGIMFGGDVKGIAAGIGDVHLVPKTLILDIGYSALSAATIQSYSKRGMNTDKNDYTIIELGDMIYMGGRLTSTFIDRRLEFYGAYYQGSSQLQNIRDRDGNILVRANDADVQRGHVTILGLRVDLTDDYYDPRRGFRLDVNRSFTPPANEGADYFVQDYNATAYVPIGRRSTWAWNYFRSDANVKRMGATDPAEIQRIQGLNCSDPALSPGDQKLCNDFVNNTIAENSYGSSSSLGGFNRLRGYSAMRYRGAHTEFYGTELRWNLTDESTPYDLFLMKDIRTAWQIAVFYEVGTIGESRSDLGDYWRSSGGAGLRMVTASGVVFRADLALGREGFSPNIFIGYPWEL